MSGDALAAFLADPARVRRLAIVRASRIGDFVCATPAFRAIRGHFPRAEVTLVGLPSVAPLVARSPHLDRHVAFPGWPGIAEQFFEPARAHAFLDEMQAERFDLALQLHGTGVYSNPFTLMLGARATAGFVRAGDPPHGLDLAVPFPGSGRECERLLALPRALGAPGDGDALEFPLLARDRLAAAQLLAGRPRPLVGLHLDAREDGKQLSARLLPPLDALVADHGTLALLGSEASTLRAATLSTLDLRGRTDLPTLGAVIASLDLLVTSDSGPAHIAYAFGTPSVTVFRTTDPARWGPRPSPRHAVVPPCPPSELPRRIFVPAHHLLGTRDSELGTRYSELG